MSVYFQRHIGKLIVILFNNISSTNSTHGNKSEQLLHRSYGYFSISNICDIRSNIFINVNTFTLKS